MNRLIQKIVTEVQISVTINDSEKFSRAFADFKTQAPHKRPQKRHFLSALAHRFFREEKIEDCGVNFYTQAEPTKTKDRVGQNIEF